MALARETIVTQSVEEFLRDQLFTVRGYPETQVELLEAFNGTLPDPASKNYVAAGFHFDEGGVQAELGSSLKTRNYIIEFIVFGIDGRWGENLASTISLALDVDGLIPLLDFSEVGKPVMDQLLVMQTSSRHEPIEKPEPWQEHVHTVTAIVQDTYYASQV